MSRGLIHGVAENIFYVSYRTWNVKIARQASHYSAVADGCGHAGGGEGV